ncbi:MAG: hypothetical protein H0W88_05865 [Parachlamydiaceae bacterium]|nr:hypothetical protein [Parachlamydiaceae bacterium]
MTAVELSQIGYSKLESQAVAGFGLQDKSPDNVIVRTAEVAATKINSHTSRIEVPKREPVIHTTTVQPRNSCHDSIERDYVDGHLHLITVNFKQDDRCDREWYQGDVRSDLQNWDDVIITGYGKMGFEYGKEFTGKFKDGLPDGQGVLSYDYGKGFHLVGQMYRERMTYQRSYRIIDGVEVDQPFPEEKEDSLCCTIM